MTNDEKQDIALLRYSVIAPLVSGQQDTYKER